MAIVHYWFSQEHQDHMNNMSDWFPSLSGYCYKPKQNLVKLNNIWYKYSACSSSSIEPFEHSMGVFNAFPDYKYLGSAEGYPILIKTPEKAEEFLTLEKAKLDPQVKELEELFLL